MWQICLWYTSPLQSTEWKKTSVAQEILKLQLLIQTLVIIKGNLDVAAHLAHDPCVKHKQRVMRSLGLVRENDRDKPVTSC